ncbi:hypothetical protein [Pengzhenrongella sicca]|uniref:Uncharacterized protein n=1 Tax=Pengzhenrongella sicca TaxID=2819238 RepID=A0A8A4Z967_9MICO|nr:hypothetical protein [Pengzhenrongella sicca]QTE28015.1 hypothetical protein J4E96_11440 [Pengzhenrongella sicca]
MEFTRGRVVLAAAVAVLVVGGVAAAGVVRSVDADRASTALSAEATRASIAAGQVGDTEAEAAQTAADAGTALADAGTATLDASAGLANESIRTQLTLALAGLRAAIANGTPEQIVATSAKVTRTSRVVENAIVASGAKQVRTAKKAEADRVAAQAAAKAVAEAAVAAKAEAAKAATAAEVTRVAADAEVARVAAVTERAQVAASAAVDQEAAAAVQYVDVAGSVAVGGWHVDGDASSTLTVDPATGACQITGADRDLKVGANVTIYDERGWVVGTGALAAGTSSGVEQQAGGGYVGTCTFGFRVTVPDAKFFQIRVADRGPVAVARADIGFVHLQPS